MVNANVIKSVSKTIKHSKRRYKSVHRKPTQKYKGGVKARAKHTGPAKDYRGNPRVQRANASWRKEPGTSAGWINTPTGLIRAHGANYGTTQRVNPDRTGGPIAQQRWRNLTVFAATALGYPQAVPKDRALKPAGHQEEQNTEWDLYLYDDSN